jgi:hypothetical protein
MDPGTRGAGPPYGDREEVLVSKKRQQTMAKMTRERTVKERRARKLEKKQAAAAERKAKADGTTVPDAGSDLTGAPVGLE